MGHGSQGLFTQVGFSDPLQDDATQNHFNVANSNPLQSQVSLIPASFFSVKNNNSGFNYEKLIACDCFYHPIPDKFGCLVIAVWCMNFVPILLVNPVFFDR